MKACLRTSTKHFRLKIKSLLIISLSLFFVTGCEYDDTFKNMYIDHKNRVAEGQNHLIAPETLADKIIKVLKVPLSTSEREILIQDIATYDTEQRTILSAHLATANFEIANYKTDDNGSTQFVLRKTDPPLNYLDLKKPSETNLQFLQYMLTTSTLTVK